MLVFASALVARASCKQSVVFDFLDLSKCTEVMHTGAPATQTCTPLRALYATCVCLRHVRPSRGPPRLDRGPAKGKCSMPLHRGGLKPRKPLCNGRVSLASPMPPRLVRGSQRMPTGAQGGCNHRLRHPAAKGHQPNPKVLLILTQKSTKLKSCNYKGCPYHQTTN